MTVKELKAFFKEHLVPSRLYNLKGGSHGGRICLGKNNRPHAVRYRERSVSAHDGRSPQSHGTGLRRHVERARMT